MPKDQLALLKRCLHNDIPAIVLSARDICSLPALYAYLEETRKHCDEGFIEDLKEVIHYFEKFKSEEPEKMQIPDL